MVASNGPAPQIDISQPHGRVVGMPGVAYMQDGAWYDLHGVLVRAPQAERPGAVLPPVIETSAVKQPAPTPTKAQRRSPAAERMRVSRLRRREGTRVIPFEMRDSEIDGLVTHGLLSLSRPATCPTDRDHLKKNYCLEPPRQ